MVNDTYYTTEEKADTHETMMPLLQAMYAEIKELSKKKPDSAVSKNKIKIVNRLLEKIRFVLSDEDSIGFLDLLDEDDIPQSSDVTLILSQYVAAMKAFHNKYFGWDGTGRNWFVQ